MGTPMRPLSQDRIKEAIRRWIDSIPSCPDSPSAATPRTLRKSGIYYVKNGYKAVDIRKFYGME